MKWVALLGLIALMAIAYLSGWVDRINLAWIQDNRAPW
jgi:Flp pilus assembly pilin Flp